MKGAKRRVHYTTILVDDGRAGHVDAEGRPEFVRQVRAREGVQRGPRRRDRGFPPRGILPRRGENLSERLLRKGPQDLVRAFVPEGPEGPHLAFQDRDAEAVPKVDRGPRVPDPKALSERPQPERDKRPSPKRFVHRILPGIDKEARGQIGQEGGGIQEAGFAGEIFKQAGKSVIVHRVTTSEYGASVAKRPFNSRLDKSKLIDKGFEPLPDWRDAVARYLRIIDDK